MCCLARADAWANTQYLERVYYPKDSGKILCGISSPCHSLLVIVCCNFLEKNAPKNFWWCSNSFLHHPWTWAKSPWEEALWFLLDQNVVVDSWKVFVNGSSYPCWITWTELLISWQYRLDLFQRTISKEFHILPCLINFSFLLPLIGDVLEGRLKHLSIFTIKFRKI